MKVRNAMHLNISGALIRTLNDLLRTTQFSEEEPKNDKVINKPTAFFFSEFDYEIIFLGRGGL